MDDLSSRLSRLGETVAEVSDRTSDPTTLPNARRRFLSGTAAAEAPRKGLSARRIGLVTAFATAVCAAAVLLFVWRREPAISFTVGASAAPGAVGQWVAPEADAPVDVRFSEGTIVTMAPGARMRVTDTSSAGATLLIERGAIHAAITHRDADTRWSLRAGPFEVRVTGTAFDARWDPATETFELTMVEGAVVVSGPRLPSERSVVAGEQLVVSASRMELSTTSGQRFRATSGHPSVATSGHPSVATSSAGATPGTASPAAPAPEDSAAPAPEESATPAPVLAPGASAAPAPSGAPAAAASWKALAQAGKHKEAMDAAEAAGFSAEVARASASELLALSDAARFAGRPARAKEALLAMRKRFGTRGNSAFLLGKIAADQLRSPGEAAVWFETYLQEQPGGPLAEQALGRLLEIRKRDPGAARLVAERYLARYPTGAYAALARSLVGR